MSTSLLPYIPLEPSPNRGGALRHDQVSLIVVHATYGSSFSSSVSWLKNPQSKASAHYVVGRAGELVQLVPLDRCAWHAGKSAWKGRPNVNFYSIGVELDNPGPLARRQDGSYVAVCNSKPVAPENVRLADCGAYKAWHTYTETQLAKLDELLAALAEKFPGAEVVGHSDISPGRKTDPGPAFEAQRPGLLTHLV